MDVLFIVVPLAVIIAGAAVGAFVWAVRRGQFDDLDTPAVRMLTSDVERERGSREREGDGERESR